MSRRRDAKPVLALVDELVVPAPVLATTCKLLRAHGAIGHELLVLWLGAYGGRTATVVHAIAPPQESLRSEEGVGYFVSGETLFELNGLLAHTKLRLIAQVHSHPGDAYHSAADDRWAVVTTDGGFSLVVPDFAAGEPFEGWAMYRLARGRWRHVAESEASRILRVVDG